MKREITWSVVAIVVFAATVPTGFAQGKGGGLNRALGASSKSGVARGLGGNSSNGLARANGSLARGSGGLNKATPGLSRAGFPRGSSLDDTTAPVTGDQSLATQQRILDHRRQQAEHLRGISERNGNTRLLDTADRMDGNAIRNFERQSGTTYQPPTDGTMTPTDGSTSPSTDGTTGSGDGSATNSVLLPAFKATAPKAKPNGFWLKSR